MRPFGSVSLENLTNTGSKATVGTEGLCGLGTEGCRGRQPGCRAPSLRLAGCLSAFNGAGSHAGEGGAPRLALGSGRGRKGERDNWEGSGPEHEPGPRQARTRPPHGSPHGWACPSPAPDIPVASRPPPWYTSPPAGLPAAPCLPDAWPGGGSPPLHREVQVILLERGATRRAPWRQAWQRRRRPGHPPGGALDASSPSPVCSRSRGARASSAWPGEPLHFGIRGCAAVENRRRVGARLYIRCPISSLTSAPVTLQTHSLCSHQAGILLLLPQGLCTGCCLHCPSPSPEASLETSWGWARSREGSENPCPRGADVQELRSGREDTSTGLPRARSCRPEQSRLPSGAALGGFLEEGVLVSGWKGRRISTSLTCPRPQAFALSPPPLAGRLQWELPPWISLPAFVAWNMSWEWLGKNVQLSSVALGVKSCFLG
nr:uncharacterized protein LOC131274030 isoform X2 [Dasypus novemcinctus]